jgi:nucleotide-binding universal stress UspA family protein
MGRISVTARNASDTRGLEIRRILLPIAGSPSEQAAIDYAAVIASALRAPITVVHVDEIPNAMVGIVPGASIEGDLAADRDLWIGRLETVAARLATRGIPEAKTLCLTSSAVGTAIVELARREHFDLIVMATHARTGISRALLGSVAEQVLRHAPCPVLTVHHPHSVVSTEP